MTYWLKQKKILFVFIGILIIISSCKRNEETCHEKEVNSGIIESNFNLGKCFYFLDSATYVINTLKDYQYLTDQIDSAYIVNIMPDCANFELYSFDFSNISLLAQYTEGNGCSVAFQRDVKNDTDNKQYLYTINIYECGNCSTTEVSMNWVQVPKLPNDYTVKFVVINN